MAKIELVSVDDLAAAVRALFAHELAEAAPIFRSAGVLAQAARGDYRDSMVRAQVQVEGVPCELSLGIRAGTQSHSDGGVCVEGHFDICLYHAELDISMADHMAQFEQIVSPPDAAGPDPWSWCQKAIEEAKAQLGECPEYVALREAAELRSYLPVVRNLSRFRI